MSGTRTPLRTWTRDLGLGIRFAVTGGKESWARTLLTAFGVGLGVALLLVAAAVPAMLAARDARTAARDANPIGQNQPKNSHTVVLQQANTTFRTDHITGYLIKGEGSRSPAPPGLTAIPGPGEMAVSPALGRMLADPGHRLLRERLSDPIVATIGQPGLSGPAELFYYAGNSTLEPGLGQGWRIDHFGRVRAPEQTDPILLLLVVIVFVVLLVPVGVFIATAVRFGGERRDRRLAALRLVGADSRMARRIAAGEALFGSLIGLLVGAVFFMVARQSIAAIDLWDLSVFPSDVTPGTTLTVLIALAVPASAIAVTLLALRAVVIEPLGVVRNAAPRRRRLWWRLLVPLLGLALLYPLIGTIGGSNGTVNKYQIATGAVLLLVGLTAVLPWLVESVVRRIGGGPLAWQLAGRRLQLNSGSAARMVSGITVAVAGAIAVQTLFAGVTGHFTSTTGQDPIRAQMMVDIHHTDGTATDRITHDFTTTPGVTSTQGTTESTATAVGQMAKAAKSADPEAIYRIPVTSVTVANCDTLTRIARITGCGPGSVFLVQPPDDGNMRVRAGQRIDLNALTDYGTVRGAPRLWTIPAGARTGRPLADAVGSEHTGILATPQALDPRALVDPAVRILLRLDPKNPDAADQARNTGVRYDPTDPTMALVSTTESNRFASIQRGLMAGAAATLVMIGASLLVSMLEQLRERKKLLAVLVAFGTRRGTLGLSVLWQTAVPVFLGLVLAVAGGLGLGGLLLAMVRTPVSFDWGSIAAMVGIGAGVVFAVTALSLPPLWRMMRPDGLRTE